MLEVHRRKSNSAILQPARLEAHNAALQKRVNWGYRSAQMRADNIEASHSPRTWRHAPCI